SWRVPALGRQGHRVDVRLPVLLLPLRIRCAVGDAQPRMATCRRLFPSRVHGCVVQPMSGKNRKASRRRGMTSECDEVSFDAICDAAHERVSAVLRCIDVLCPGLDPRPKKHLANKILTLCDGKDRSVKITQGQAQALIMPHLQCIRTDCPQLCFWEPVARNLNLFFS